MIEFALWLPAHAKMKSVNVFVLLVILTMLVISLFPQDSHEVIFVLSHGKVRAIRQKEEKGKQQVVTQVPGKAKIDSEAEAKKRKRRRRKKMKKLRELIRWLRKEKQTVVSIHIQVNSWCMGDKELACQNCIIFPKANDEDI